MLKNSLLAAAIALTLGAPAAFAAEPQQLDGSVTVAVSPLTSQGDVARQLGQSGYSDIRLTPVRPTQIDPRPDLEDAGSTVAADQTPVHSGWNGSAVRNGQRVNVLVNEQRA